MVTRRGKIKRVSLEEFESVRPSGLVAITLDEKDSLDWVRATTGSQEVILVTERGQALRFSEKQVRPMGRPAAGVAGIRLKAGDSVTSAEVVDPEGDLLVVTTKGFGKRTPLKEYTPKGRATARNSHHRAEEHGRHRADRRGAGGARRGRPDRGHLRRRGAAHGSQSDPAARAGRRWARI